MSILFTGLLTLPWFTSSHISSLIQICPRYETNATGAITGSVGFARLSGVDGRLTTNVATLVSTATSASAFNPPTGSSTPGSNGGRNPEGNGASSSGRLQSRGPEYGFLVVGVSLLLSLM